MPTWRALLAHWPHSVLRASEDAVGLPPGQMGNSEVGHLNLGAGRPVLQDLPRIDAAIDDGSFFTRPALLAACERARADGVLAHRQPDRAGRRARQRPAPRRARRSWPRARASPGAHPRAPRRPRHAAVVGGRLRRSTWSRGWRPPTPARRSRPSAGATSRWTATAAGSGSSRAMTRSSTPRRRTGRSPRRPPSRLPMPAARPTSSSAPR